MSLYLLPENQRLLWDTMSKIPTFQQWEPVLGSKTEWFQQIIFQFHEQRKFERITKQTLPQMNKETLMYMMQQLKVSSTTPHSSFPQSSYSYSTPFASTPIFPEESERKLASRDYMAEQKQLELNQQFLNRQKEYEITTSAPKEIDFREPVKEDGPIENMDELVKQHIRQREMEISQTVSEIPPGTPTLSILPTTLPPSSLNVVELDMKLDTRTKKVQWEDEGITLRQLHQEIQQMKKEIIELIQYLHRSPYEPVESKISSESST
jgi:hypothetical protein